MEFKKIEIKSNNTDFCGTWIKEDVEDEIRECYGIEPVDDIWIEEVIEINISIADKEVGKIIEETIKNKLIEDIKFRIPNGDWIRITKTK